MLATWLSYGAISKEWIKGDYASYLGGNASYDFGVDRNLVLLCSLMLQLLVMEKKDLAKS